MTAQITGEIPPETPENSRCCPECHQVLAELRPYLPLLAHAARWLDNPAIRFRIRRPKGTDDD